MEDMVKVAAIVGALVVLLAVAFLWFRHKDPPQNEFEEWDRKQW